MFKDRQLLTRYMITLHTGEEFGCSGDSCVHDFIVHRRSAHRETTCDCQFITGYMIILYTADRYEQYNAKRNMYIRCRDNDFQWSNLEINLRSNRILNENYII